MFGKKKNIADKMTAAYEAAHKQADIGKRYLALVRIEKDIARATKAPKYLQGGDTKTVFGSAGVGVVVGATAAAVAGAAFPIVLITGLIGAVPGMLGGMVYDLGGIRKWNETRKQENFRMHYIRNIQPHLPVLNGITQQVTEDKDKIMTVENADALHKSAVLKDVVRAYPKLVDIFTQAQRNVKPVPPPRHDGGPTGLSL